MDLRLTLDEYINSRRKQRLEKARASGGNMSDEERIRSLETRLKFVSLELSACTKELTALKRLEEAKIQYPSIGQIIEIGSAKTKFKVSDITGRRVSLVPVFEE